MDRKPRLLLWLMMPLLLLATTAAAKEQTLSGHVKDQSSGEALIGANIYVKGTTIGTVTNVYGFYSLSLPEGKHEIVFSYIGYDPIEKEIDLSQEQEMTIELAPTSNTIEEVVVTSQKKNENILTSKMGIEKMSSKTIEQIPVFGGEADVIKSLNLLPGIRTTGETSSSLSVRGGSRDQNMIMLDEATVYNASHFLGLFSVFNNDAIKSVEMYKGTMPANYGGRVSSFIDIRMKEGNSKKFSGKASVGLISTKLTLEAPIVKDKGSFMVSGRRTYIDLVTKALHKSNKDVPEIPTYFYDLNMKANYAINSKHRLYLSGYFGRDVVDIKTGGNNMRMNWGNYTGTLRWNYIINKKLFSNVSLIASNYNYLIERKLKAGSDKKEYNYTWDSELRDYTAKVDFGYYLNPNNTLKFGAMTTYHDIDVGKLKGRNDTVPFNFSMPRIYSFEHAFYVSNTQKLTPAITLEYGLRMSMLQNRGAADELVLEDYEVIDTVKHSSGKIFNTDVQFEPRFSLNYVLSPKHSIKVGYTRASQYMHVASNSVSGTPIDIWVPSDPNIKPQISDQVSIGYFRNFMENSIQASVELYYKSMQNQIEFKEFSQPYLNPELIEEFRFGEGRAYGFELMVKKATGKLTGWVSYTYSHSERKIKDIQEKDWFLSPYDMPHDIAFVGMYKISERLSFSMNWIYQTGKPFTAPVGRYEFGGEIFPIYDGRNNDRMPNYHRMDIGLELKNKPKAKYESSWTFSIYNLYNRKNANVVYFEQEEGTHNTRAMQMAIMPIIPSISYNIKF